MAYPRREGVALVLVLVAALLVTVGCRQQKVVTCGANEGYDPKLGVCYPCPAGTKANHATATCVPVDDEDVATDGGQDGRDQPDLSKPPDESSAPDEVSEMPDLGGDNETTQPGDLVAPGQVGAACNKDTDCDDGLLCFDWPGGYCIGPDCTEDGDCPEGAACLPLLQNAQACFDRCGADADCRAGYGCKAIATIGGEAQKVCHPIGEDPGELGEACEGHDECAGSLACVKLGPKSMCAQTGCSGFELCPEGAACVPWGVMTICLPECTANEECALLAGSEAYTCQTMEDVFEEDRQVCSAAQQGLPIGDLCFFSTECESGYCQLIISGLCSGPDGSECGTDADCPEGLCLPNPSAQRGICSQPCGPGSTCPEGSYCGNDMDGAICLAQCQNYGQSCGPDGFGMVCTYGTLFYPSAPAGKYACSKAPGGEAGAPCGNAEDCNSGLCYGPESGTGYCATSCFTDKDCPFGALCMQDVLATGQALCTKLCFGDIDCPTGFSCKNTFFEEKACQL